MGGAGDAVPFGPVTAARMPDARRGRAGPLPLRCRGRRPVQPPLLLRLSSRLPPGAAQGGNSLSRLPSRSTIPQRPRVWHTTGRFIHVDGDFTWIVTAPGGHRLDWQSCATHGQSCQRKLGSWVRQEPGRRAIELTYTSRVGSNKGSWPRRQPIRVS